MKEETKQNIKNKIEDTKTKVKESGRKTLRWIDHNKEFVLMAGATVIGAGAKLAQARNKQRELDLRTNTIYDPSTGRAMSSSEQLEFEYRKKAGESTGVILDDMNLLK